MEVRYEEEGIWNQGVAAWIGPANGRWAMFSVEMGACPLHGSKFNVRPGAALEAPAKDPLKTHRATFDGEVGGVDVPPALTVRSE